MTEAEVIDRINSTIKKNGNRTITGDEMNFILKAIIELIVESGGLKPLDSVLADGNETLEYDIILTELDRIVVGANRAGLGKGTFNTGRGGDKGVSLQCAVELELNWQAGFLRVLAPGGDGTPLILQTDSEIVYTSLVPTTPTYGRSLIDKDYLDGELAGKEDTANKGAANGYAPLNSSSKIDNTYLPSYVDDVIEVANFAALPPTGEVGKIYITLDDNKTYRWSGSAYVEISASLALGETSGSAYRGDRGKIAYDHSQTTGNPHGTTATQVDALKRDGSNANSDIDISNYDLNIKGIKVKGTAGNGHLNLKHQSIASTAGGNESVLYADSIGNPRWKNDGNAVQNVMLENAPITPGTYNEVTVDSKGLVTSGSVKWGLLSGNPNSATGVLSGSARYYTFGDGVPQNAYTFRQIVFVQPTIVKFFAIVTITSQPATGSCVFTVQKNGVDTGIVITVASGAASGTFSEIATQVSFSQFDTISVKAVNNAALTSCVVASLSIGIQ
jgi:hypothetical protein